MDQIALLSVPAARMHRRASGRRALSTIAVLVLGLVGATGLADALTAPSTTAALVGSHGTAVYAVSAPAAALLPKAARASAAGRTEGPSGGAAVLAVNGGVRASAPPSTPALSHGALVEETGAITEVVPGADIQADTTALMNVATAYGGFVASTQTQTASPGSPAQSTVTLQVPEPGFDQVHNAK